MFRTRDLLEFIRKYPRQIVATLGAIFCIGLLAVAANYVYIGTYGKHLTTVDALPSTNPPVAIVFGGGIENGKPKPLLKDRLDTGAKLLEQGKVRKLLVSGDNRFVNYNEPQVMKSYLIHEKHIDASKIQLDNAGRSTYETCERAKKIFGLNTAVLVSESTHLPRAIYTCRTFGITAIGVSSDGQAAAGLRVGQRFREVLARTKATLNSYVIGEKTILGEKISL